jgi:hypothetical protein
VQHEVPLERTLKRYLILRLLSALDLLEDVHVRPRPVALFTSWVQLRRKEGGGGGRRGVK